MQRGSALPLLLVALFLLGAGLAGFFLANSNQPKVPESDQIKVNEISPPASPKAANSSDDLLGLSFEIPSGYKMIKETEEEYFKRANGQIRKNFNYYVLYNPAEFAEAFYVLAGSENNPDKAILTVWVFQNPEDLDPEKFYGKYWYYPFVWGEFSSAKNKIAPVDLELVGGKESKFGVVDYRDNKPKFSYLPLRDKKLMMQIQYPDDNPVAEDILRSFKFE